MGQRRRASSWRLSQRIEYRISNLVSHLALWQHQAGVGVPGFGIQTQFLSPVVGRSLRRYRGSRAVWNRRARYFLLLDTRLRTKASVKIHWFRRIWAAS